jgi:simple sugar transport system substrate-binding protein
VVGQDGKAVECEGGDHLDDGQVLGMNFYVKGVDDTIPGST